MPKCDPRDEIFYPTLSIMNNSYNIMWLIISIGYVIYKQTVSYNSITYTKSNKYIFLAIFSFVKTNLKHIGEVYIA